MDALPAARKDIPADARKAIARLLPAPQLKYRVVRRIAGVGSLGHPRYVAVADWRGGQIALEAKAATPSACVWAKPGRPSQIYYQVMLEQAIRCPDPFVRLSGKWLVRQLAPDSSPIEIETMSGLKDQDRLLHAMAWETANVHLGTTRATQRVIADLKNRSGKWLPSAVKDMAGRPSTTGMNGKRPTARHDILLPGLRRASLVRNESGMTWRLVSLAGARRSRLMPDQACFIEWCLTCLSDPREESLDGK